MTRLRWSAKYPSVVALLAVVAFLSADGYGQSTRPRRVAVFGSSVANGTGDEFRREGYTGLLREMLAARGWEVLNQSRGGDTTVRMAARFEPQGTPDPNVRYLTPVNPGYVVIGLSLANEGVWEAKTRADKDAIFKQYADGIKGFIDKARQRNIVPVVALVYPRLVYTAVEYDYVRRMNLLQNSWDVPTVNFLGATEDGAGRWARGFGFDDKHPNAAGHRELLYAFVPTLFEALEKGKPTPTRPSGKAFARVTGGTAPLAFSPPDTMHAFAMGLTVRARGDGTLATVTGSTLMAKTDMKRTEAAVPVEFESTTLTPDGNFTAAISIQNGKWAYRSANGTSVESSVDADGQWHDILLSHYTARGETLYFVDGNLAARIAERMQPRQFTFGGAGATGPTGLRQAPKPADYKDVFVFRSALNPDEAAALHEGKLLQASLEIYAPLTDAQFTPNSEVENRAQSLTALKVGAGSQIAHMEESAAQAVRVERR